MKQHFGPRQKQSAVILGIFLLGIIFVSTRRDPESPEAAIEKAIYAMVEGAEQKDKDPFRKYLSETIHDNHGNNYESLMRTITGIFFRYPKINLNVVSINFLDSSNPNEIPVDLTLLMSGSNLPEDASTFTLTFREENGTWRVIEVIWADRW